MGIIQNKEKVIDKPRVRWHPVTLHLQEGDIITSKKGILQQSPITNNHYSVKRLTFVGDNHFIVLGEKEEIVDIEIIKGDKNGKKDNSRR